MSNIKIGLFSFFFMFLVACGTSPMENWLQEYEELLKAGASEFIVNPDSESMQQIQYQISEKEASVDQLLRNASMQDQMRFLSRYYDMRVNFYYAVQ